MELLKQEADQMEFRVQMKELCNLQNRRSSVYANLGRTDRQAHVLILTTMDQNDQNEPGQ